MLDCGEEIVLSVNALSSEGDGIGVYQGLKVFVPDLLIGERGLVKIVERKPRYAIAKLLNRLNSSPDRIVPACPFVGACGGCEIAHLAYEGQLRVKKERVQECMKRIAHLDDFFIDDCAPSPLPFHYRHKIQLPIVYEVIAKLALPGKTDDFWAGSKFPNFLPKTHSPDDETYTRSIGESSGVESGPKRAVLTGEWSFAITSKEKKQKIGLFRKKSHDVIEVDRCAIHCENGEEILQKIRPLISKFQSLRYLLIKNSYATKEALIVFVTSGGETEELKACARTIMELLPSVVGVIESINTSESNRILGSRFDLLAGRMFLMESLLGMKFQVSAPSFFQVNPPQAERIFQKALSLVELNPNDVVLDAYTGVGVFALLAAQLAKKVIGIEIVEGAIADAKANAHLNRIQNASFHVGQAESMISRFRSDLLFLNPPRKGCDLALINEVIKNPPRKLLYLSCDPATLARDVALLSQGGFTLHSLHPFDLFPQTMHVETLALLLPSGSH